MGTQPGDLRKERFDYQQAKGHLRIMRGQTGAEKRIGWMVVFFLLFVIVFTFFFTEGREIGGRWEGGGQWNGETLWDYYWREEGTLRGAWGGTVN